MLPCQGPHCKSVAEELATAGRPEGEQREVKTKLSSSWWCAFLSV